MSNTYVTEPVTKGKVIIVTDFGPVDVELWSKEAPKAVRNFVQLCLEGYYDGCIFHRIVKDFIAQTGDPTGTGSGGESIYGKPFADEYHSRLKFNRRGILGMASNGPESNTSQFFITLNKAEELNGKHTIFGKITGETIFNVTKMEELEMGAEDRPLNPPKILSVEVLSNPFPDIIPREKRKQIAAAPVEKVEKKGTKNLSVLSFGEEAEEDEFQIKRQGNTKIKSAYHFSEDPITKKQVEENERKKAEFKAQEEERKRLEKGKEPSTEVKRNKKDDDQLESDRANQRQKALDKRMLELDNDRDDENLTEEKRARKAEQQRLVQEILDKKKGKKEDVDEAKKEKKDENKKGKDFLKDQRKKYMKNKNKASKEDKQHNISEKLESFKQTLHSKPSESEQPPEKKEKEKEEGEDGASERGSGDADDNDKGWMHHTLVFEKAEMEKTKIDPMLKEPKYEQDDGYVVYDSRKGKKDAVPTKHHQSLYGIKKLERW